MNPSPQAIVAEALQKGWISFQPAKPAKVLTSTYLRYEKPRRERLYAAGLTSRGKKRKQHPPTPPEVLQAAERDGVSVAAIYNRLARTGRLTLRKEKP